MGEIKFEKKTLVEAINTTLQKTEQTAAEQSVATPGGRFHVRWDVAATVGFVRRRLANRCGGDRSGNRAIAAACSAEA